jgi:hypothetical protein
VSRCRRNACRSQPAVFFIILLIRVLVLAIIIRIVTIIVSSLSLLWKFDLERIFLAVLLGHRLFGALFRVMD